MVQAEFSFPEEAVTPATIGTVLAIGFPQGEEEMGEQYDYDVFCMKKTPTHYFLGLVRFGWEKGWRSKRRREKHEAEFRPKDPVRVSDLMTRFRISGGVDKYHYAFSMAMGTGFNEFLPQNNYQLEIKGSYENCQSSWRFGANGAGDYHSKWTLRGAKLPAEYLSKIGCCASLGSIALKSGRYSDFLNRLYSGMETERHKKRGMELDWEKIPTRALTEAEMNDRGTGLAEFNKRTGYLEAAVV